MPSCTKCGNEFPSRIIIDGVSKTLHKRKYCLDCSPWNEHNTRKIEHNTEGAKRCPCCNDVKPINEFYVRKDRDDPSAYCIECNRKKSSERTKAAKIKMVEYKGGKCKSCGYDTCYDALEFHHVNRDTKAFGLSQIRAITDVNWQTVKDELDKCVLVCCRCHREIEAGIIPCPSITI